MKILYVEDNYANRLVLERGLANLVDIDTEENGFKAFKMAEEKDYDIYILDLNLGDPEIDGISLLKKLKTIRPHAIYAALTAFDDDEWKERCERSGFDLFFGKPVNAKELLKSIEDYRKEKPSLGK